MPHDPILALLPESKYAWSLDKNLTPVIAQIPSEDDDDDPDTPTIPVAIPANEFAVTVCPMKDGSVCVLYDDVSVANRSVLRFFDPATGEQIGTEITVHDPAPDGGLSGNLVRIGELGAFKSLMDIGCGKVLTNDRNTHEVIEVKVSAITDDYTPVDPDSEELPDPQIGEVVKRYSLVVDPLDAAVNAAATRLLYEDDGEKLWDLEEDAAIRTVVAV